MFVLNQLIVDNGVLIYDETDERCQCYVHGSQGKLYAFIICIDKGCPSQTKRYWGEWDWNNKEKSVLGIMESGGKWDGWKLC